jgi:hypothetical protein
LVGGGGWGTFFKICFLCSQWVFNICSLGSQCVPQECSQ